LVGRFIFRIVAVETAFDIDLISDIVGFEQKE